MTHYRQLVDDLQRRFDLIVGQCPRGGILDRVYALIADMPAPRYYITPRGARVGISRMVRGKWAPATARRLAMFESLRHSALVIAAERHIPFARAVALAVDTPAPSFFLAPTTVRNIICLNHRLRIDGERRQQERNNLNNKQSNQINS